MLRNTLKVTEVKACTFIILLSLACTLLLGMSGQGSTSEPSGKWEYCCAMRVEAPPVPNQTWVIRPVAALDDKWKDATADIVLNRLGMDGWQLVSVHDEVPIVRGAVSTAFYLIRSKKP